MDARGWSHLYTIPWSGGEPRALTSGAWEVQEAKLSRDRSRFFLQTNEGDHSQKQICIMSAAGGERVKLTSSSGYHEAVLFVHGAGYAQNVHKGWSNYYRESMFNQILMKNGYSARHRLPRIGRIWTRLADGRHMGGKDLDDHVDAAGWLVKEHGVDPKRSASGFTVGATVAS